MNPPVVTRLSSRALVKLTGPDWRSFLQGLITQDVESLQEGELRFGALLTPQGRLLYDLFVCAIGDGALIECEAALRGPLIQRLTLYRLRAKVQIGPDDAPVLALWEAPPPAGSWRPDPRLPALGWRGYGAGIPDGASLVGEEVYEAWRLALGVPGPADFGSDRAYPIEADFDLLAGIDFRKGCFVGQETTSRMKRRGQIKSRMLPVVFEGDPPPPGTEVLAGSLRAGEILSGASGRAMALVRLDRAKGAALTLGHGRPCRLAPPDWLPAAD